MFCCCTLRDTCFEKYGVVNCLSLALAWPQECPAQVKSGGVRDLPLLLCHATISTQRENLHSARHICATCKGVWKTVSTLFLETWSHVCLLTLQFSRSVVSKSLWSHGLQHTRPPCPLPTPGVYSNSCALRPWCHPTISSSVVPFSSWLQSSPASGSFLMSQFFASGGQQIGVSASASVLPMNIQDCFPLGWTGWISLQAKGLSRVFSNTTVQKH